MKKKKKKGTQTHRKRDQIDNNQKPGMGKVIKRYNVPVIG